MTCSKCYAQGCGGDCEPNTLPTDDTDPGPNTILLPSGDDHGEIFLLKEKVKELTLDNQKLKDELESKQQEIDLHNRLVTKLHSQLTSLCIDINDFNKALTKVV